MGKGLEHVGTGINFINKTAMAYDLRSRFNKCDFIEFESIYKTKDTFFKTKGQPTDWEKIFTNSTSDIGLISNIY